MKIKSILVIIFCISVSACGYIPVRTPFVISSNCYREQSIHQDRLRLLCWNTNKATNDDRWKKDFINIVNNKKPEFILLQEVRLERTIIEILKNDVNMGWEFSPNLFQGTHDAYSGVLTASYAKPTAVMPALSNGTEPLTQTPKPVLFTKYDLGLASSELLVINIHGINFKIGLDEFKEQLRFIAGRVMMHDGPVIMAGDFNTWSDKRAGYLNKIAGEMGLVKVSFGSASTDTEASVTNSLDHIFISEIKLEAVYGSGEAIMDIHSSDHAPLFIELKIPQ